MRSLRRLVIAVLAAVTFVGPLAAPATAQSADRIAANLNAEGVFVDSGADGDAAEFRQVVQQLSGEGIELLIASIAEEPTNLQQLAEDLRDLTNATVLLITPASLAASSPVFDSGEIDAALDATSFSNLADGALEFGRRLNGVAVSTPTTDVTATTAAPSTTPDTTPVTNSTPAAESSGGGGSGFLIFLLIVVGGIVGLVLFTRSRNRKKVEAELTQRRATVNDELAAIGADIVELEDRVTFADDDEATKHFRLGNEQYIELQDQLAAATTLWEVTQVDYAADTAAWHLDASEAIIDGEDIPEEPERPDLTVSRPPEEREVERERSRAAERERVESRLPDRHRDQESRRVEPRRQRRQGWDRPKTRGTSLGDIATGILVGGILNGGGGGRRAPRRWGGGGDLGSARGGGFGSASRGGGGFGSISRGGGGFGSRSRGGSGSRSR